MVTGMPIGVPLPTGVVPVTLVSWPQSVIFWSGAPGVVSVEQYRRQAIDVVPPVLLMSEKGTPLQPFLVLSGFELVPAAPVSQVTASPGIQPEATGPTTWLPQNDPAAVLGPSRRGKSTGSAASLA